MIWIEGKTHRPSLLCYRFLVILNDVKDLKQFGMILRQALEPSRGRLGNRPSQYTAVSMHKIPHCVRDDKVALEEGGLGHDSHQGVYDLVGQAIAPVFRSSSLAKHRITA
jgi:hypothetical protein